MGLFDTVKLKANALAVDAERAGKVTAAQARTVALQNEIRKAERELGHSAFPLIESGEIVHPDLEAASARLRDARQALTDKEAEIEALRGRAAQADPATAATADSTQTVTPEPTGTASIAEEPPVAETAAAAEAATDATKKPAAKRRTSAAKKPAPKKAAAPKTAPAKKKPAAKKTPAATTSPAEGA
ncbi:MAG: hypothetical protein NTW58_02765 [Actinobacteria bacterium]|nr:hypothetical protein [Actinomycetota bacterium]